VHACMHVSVVMCRLPNEVKYFLLVLVVVCWFVPYSGLSLICKFCSTPFMKEFLLK
jgi:hypothetical protein